MAEEVTNREDVINRARGLYDYAADQEQQNARDANTQNAIKILFQRVAAIEEQLGMNDKKESQGRNLNIQGQAASSSPIEDAISNTVQQANAPQGM